MRCILIDDEPRALELLENFIKKTTLEISGQFRDPLDAIKFLNQNQVDLIFLDINMPNLNGMQFIEVLNIKPLIIFTTAYPEYAIDSYKHNAVDYLLKPFEFTRFLSAVNKAIDRFKLLNINISDTETLVEPINKTIYIKSSTKLQKLNLSEILFIEKMGHNLIFHSNNSDIESRMNMKDIFTLIPKEQFIQVHKSFVVSLSSIDTFENQQLHIGNQKIPIGSSFKSALLERIKK